MLVDYKLTPAAVLLSLIAACSTASDETAVAPGDDAQRSSPVATDDALAAPTPAKPAKSKSIEEEPFVQVEPARLVPEEAVLYGQLASFADLEGFALKLMSGIAPELLANWSVEETIEQAMGVECNVSLIARDKPVGVAFVMVEGENEPQPIFIVPCKNAHSFSRSVRGGSSFARPVVADPYVVVSHWKNYRIPNEPGEFAKDMPKAEIALRINVEALYERFGPLLQAGVAQAGQMAVSQRVAGGTLDATDEQQVDVEQAMVQRMADSALMVMRGTDRADLWLTMHGSTLEFGSELLAVAGGPLDGFASKEPVDLAARAGWLDTTDAIQGAWSIEPALWKGLTGQFEEGLMEALVRPGEQDQDDPEARLMEETLENLSRALGEFGSLAAGFSGDLERHGTTLCWHFESEDPQALFSRLRSSVAEASLDQLGLIVSAPSESRVEGVPVHELRVSFDRERVLARRAERGLPAPADGFDPNDLFEHLFDSPEMRLRFAWDKRHAVLAVGADDDWFRRVALSIGNANVKLPADVDQALQQVRGANPCFVAKVDLASWMRGCQQMITYGLAERLGRSETEAELLLASMPTFQQAAPCTLYGALEDRAWRFGMFVDVPKMVAAMKSLQALQVQPR